MKILRIIVGFILVLIGIGALANQTAILGLHPAVWFILGAGLLLGDAAWEHLVQGQTLEEDATEEIIEK